MVKTTDQLLLEAIQGLRDDIARIDRDLSQDRTANEHLAMAVNSNSEQVAQFGKRLELIERKIQDKMADVVAPMIESTENLTTAIEDKRLTAEKMVKVGKKKWWKGWR